LLYRLSYRTFHPSGSLNSLLGKQRYGFWLKTQPKKLLFGRIIYYWTGVDPVRAATCNVLPGMGQERRKALLRPAFYLF